MRRWGPGGGFSLDAAVRREATDRWRWKARAGDWFADTFSVDNSRLSS